MKGNIFMISFSVYLVMLYRKTIDFRKLILYPATLSPKLGIYLLFL